MLKIGIVGLGGVGGYISAKLIQSGLAEVSLLGRGKHLETIKKNGLKIIDEDTEFIVKPSNLIDTQNDEKGQIFDFIFVTTKSYSFKEISKNLSLHVDQSTIIIPLSNGVNHKAILNNYIKNTIVIDGCIYILSNIEDNGVIKKKAPTFYLILGDFKNRFQDRLQNLANILNKSGLKSKLSKNIEYDCWVKYLLISSFATLTSYYAKPLGYIVKEKYSLLKEVLEEIKSVANALHVNIGEAEIEKTIKQVQNVPYNSKTSMQIDFENKHANELESLAGYIVKEAKRLKIEVKNIEMMYEKLSQKSL